MAGDQQLAVVLTIDDEKYSDALERAKQGIRKLKAESEAAGHATVSEMQAASGAIRLFEGNVMMMQRALERFITTIPGVGAALQAAFPLVGAVALIGVVAKLGIELYKTYDAATKLTEKFEKGFSEMSESIQDKTDQMRLKTIELANQLDILNGKYASHMFEESMQRGIVQANELYDTLHKAVQEYLKLGTESSIGFKESAMTGQASTTQAEKEIKSALDDLDALGLKRKQEADNNGTGTDRYKRLDAAYEGQVSALMQQFNDSAANPTKHLPWYQRLAGSTGSIGDTTGISERFMNATKLLQENRDYSNSKSAYDKYQADTDEARKNKEASAAAAKAAREWAEYLKEGTKTLFGRGEGITASDLNRNRQNQSDYYPGGFNIFTGQTQGELQKHLAMQGDDEGQLRRQNDLSGRLNFDESRHEQERNNSTQDIWNKSEDQIAERGLAFKEAQGYITQYDEAIQLAALHEEEYTRTNAMLQDQLSNAATPQDAERIKTQITENDARHAEQQQSDRQNTIGTDPSFSSQFSESIRKFVQATSDFPKQLSDTLMQTLHGLNDDIVNGKGFKNTLADAGKGIARSGLENVEGSLLSGLTGKNPTAKQGTEANPMWIRDVDGHSGKAGGAAGNVVGSVAGGALSKMGGFGKFLGGILPGFADGGEPEVNAPSIIGEMGPEIFVPKQAGTIIPNNKAFGGGDTHYNVNVHNSTDPHMTTQMVKQALQQTHKQSVSGALKANMEQNLRKAPTARR